MGQINLEIRDKNISSYLTTNKQLSILLGMDSFVYMVVSQGRIVVLKNYSLKDYNKKYAHLYLDDLQHILLTDPDLKPSFQKIFVGLVHPLAAIVPDGLYDERDRSVFLHHLTDQFDDLAIFTANLPLAEAKVVYTLDHQIVRVLDHLLPTAHITHIWASVINHLLDHHCGHQPSRHLFVNFHLRNIEIFAFDQKWLIFANSFTFEQAEDVLYAIMVVIQELKLEAETIPVFLAGEMIKDSAIYRLLYRFFPKMQFYEEELFYEFGPKMQQLPPHYFVDLMSISKVY